MDEKENKYLSCMLRCSYIVHRMLGPMLEANVWANMERMLGPMLVVWAAGYTMCQIAQHWKQTFGSSHSLHSNIGSILWCETKKPTADRLPSNANIGSWPFVNRHSRLGYTMCFNASSVQHWKYLTNCVAAALKVLRHSPFHPAGSLPFLLECSNCTTLWQMHASNT